MLLHIQKLESEGFDVIIFGIISKNARLIFKNYFNSASSRIIKKAEILVSYFTESQNFKDKEFSDCLIQSAHLQIQKL